MNILLDIQNIIIFILLLVLIFSNLLLFRINKLEKLNSKKLESELDGYKFNILNLTNANNENLKKNNILVDVFPIVDENFKKFLETKFEFYFFTELAAYKILNKNYDTKVLNDCRNKFLIDITTGLDPYIKKILINFYTNDGLELYIIQYFLISLNKYDLNFQNKHLNIDKGLINAVFGS